MAQVLIQGSEGEEDSTEAWLMGDHELGLQDR